MEDKTFQLLEKMYSEFSTRFDKVEADIQGLKGDVRGLKNDVLRIEHDHGQKLQALFDGYKQHDQRLDVLEKKIDNLTEKVDRHDIKIQVIEGGRRS
jgi:predicted  nucleic acid-binding Zn-ribbon protein